MKLFVKIIIAISVIALGVSVFATLFYYSKISKSYDDETTSVYSENPKYHFSLILNSQQDEYWVQFKQGVFDAAREKNIVIEYNQATYTDSEASMIEYIDIADKAMLDGIIINGFTSKAYSEAIKTAAQNGMSVVLAGDESVEDNKLSYVGTNFYDFGVQAAQLISQIGDENLAVNAAVILSGDQSENTESGAVTHEHALLTGLNSAALQNEREINFLPTLYRQSELLGAEDLTRSVLEEYETTNVIFCTNAKDTLAAAKVIIEKNLVGKVFIVGTNVNEEIISMIEKGIVYGVLDRNGYNAGYSSVEALVNSMEDKFQSSFIDIDIEIYTLMNIHKYKEN